MAKIKVPGKAFYGGMLDHNTGVIYDLITYYLSDTHYRIAVNSATSEKYLSWIVQEVKYFDVFITERPELAMITIQGHNAKAEDMTVFNTKQIQWLKV